MLTTFRRHYPPCKHAGVADSRRHRHCQCPIWVQGTLAGQTIKRAVDLRSWQAASDLVRDWEADGEITIKPEVPTIRQATDKFLADAAAQNLSPETIRTYRNVLEHRLVAGADPADLFSYASLGSRRCESFRQSWPDGPNYAAKRARTTADVYCEAANWVERNPAKP